MKNIFSLSCGIVIVIAAVTAVAAGTKKDQVKDAAGKDRNPAASTYHRHLAGDVAAAFIMKHFPNADIPGPVKGSYLYQVHARSGSATCNYPAMGAKSAGDVATCTLKEGDTTRTIQEDEAVSFIQANFPNADIPGPVKGKYQYGGKIKKATADCDYPAMGARSDGAVVTCDVEYTEI